jgi:hypothetical protein
MQCMTSWGQCMQGINSDTCTVTVRAINWVGPQKLLDILGNSREHVVAWPGFTARDIIHVAPSTYLLPKSGSELELELEVNQHLPD